MGISKKDYVEQVEQNKKSLYRVAYSYMREQALAMDAVDEAVYKGYVNRGKLQKEECFKTWITRIVVNECLQQLSKKKREVLVDELSGNAAALNNPHMTSEEMDAFPIKEALSKLSQELASIIYLRFFGGYTLAETAAILKVPQGTVATRERRALALLRLELQ